MLLRFEAANHRSIFTPIELSLIAVDDDRLATRQFEALSEQVLTVAGVYGANASGKSNVLDALRWVAMAVRQSLRSWDETIPRDPFKFGDGPTSSSSFTVEMLVRGVRYEYRLELDDHLVTVESLYSYPKRQRRTLFEREGMDLSLRRGLASMSGIRSLLTPTTLALSAALRFDGLADDPDAYGLTSFGRALSGVGVQGLRRRPVRRRLPGYWPSTAFSTVHNTERIFLDAEAPTNQLALSGLGTREDRKAMALGLLKFADFGIDDVEVVEPQDGDTESRPYLRLLHRSRAQHVAFDLFEESEGTQTWFRLIGPTLRALRTGMTLLFDEIDASLHPRLSARLLELFQDPETNSQGAQLIFTTHDTSLLNHLNRDEVWLTEKGRDGETRLTALAEYGGDKVRRSLNLEKAYLQGRFGAVPELDQYQLRMALAKQPTVARQDHEKAEQEALEVGGSSPDNGVFLDLDEE